MMADPDRPTNRPLHPAKIAEYRRALRRKRFVPNGEPIILTVDGKVLDGQNRLTAAGEEDIDLRTYVVYLNGVVKPIDAFETMDSGAGRSAGEVLHILGEKNYNLLAAIVKRAIYWGQGVREAKVAPTKHEVAVYVRRHKIVREMAALVQSYHAELRGVINGSLLGFVGYEAMQIDREKAFKFVTAVATGENLSKKNPAMALRSRLIANSTAKAKLTQKEVLALTIKTWNSYRKQKTVSTLRWQSAQEPFPTFER